ncbi:MAG: alcohol dehydrogenase catalytic domain-containing protein [Candidatus Eremiobacteraeota bacterium]|nr:alcohol dehydrogenase catalytic domain-containing protein [Candidatus Eremiobacteraeota bacterium]
MRAARVPSATDHRLELAEIDIPQPEAGSVRIRVEACGICHSDSITVNSVWPITYPRAPGHEIAGTIDAVTEGVIGFNVGDRVGVGWHGGHCGHCDRCRRGEFLKCRFLRVPGQAYDGGYAQYVVVPAGALARIPSGLTAEEAAPLMCAGVTTYNALRHSKARAGDRVAILGIGGLGHLGIQYAAKMGFNTVAIARGTDKEELARRLGAQHYVDSLAGDAGQALRDLGGAKVVLSTVTSANAIEPVLNGLGLYGELIVVGAAHEPLPLNTAAMLGGSISVRAWASGTCVDSEDTMNFSVQAGIRPMIETMPIERAQEAFDRMMSGAARFRMVLMHGE